MEQVRSSWDLPDTHLGVGGLTARHAIGLEDACELLMCALHSGSYKAFDQGELKAGLAPRIFFIFAPLGGVQRGGGTSLKSEEKGGKKRGGEEGSMQEKGQGHSWEGGVLNIYFEG